MTGTQGRDRVCAACDADNHSRCRDPRCACCGDYDDPEPIQADPKQYGAEEDRRLNQQLGPYPEVNQ